MEAISYAPAGGHRMPWHLGPARCPASPPKAGGAPPACTAPRDPTCSIPGSLLPTQPCAKWHFSRAVISSPAPGPASCPPGGCALPCPAPSLQLPTAPALQRTRPAANKLPSAARMNAPALHGSKVLLLPDKRPCSEQLRGTVPGPAHPPERCAPRTGWHPRRRLAQPGPRGLNLHAEPCGFLLGT